MAAPYCTLGRSDAAGEELGSLAVPLQQAVLMHDFAITERFAVFIDGSLVIDTGVCWNSASHTTVLLSSEHFDFANTH